MEISPGLERAGTTLGNRPIKLIPSPIRWEKVAAGRMRVVSRVPPLPLPRLSFWFVSFLPPFQGLISFGLITRGGARFTSLAPGYYLSGFQPFYHSPACVSKLRPRVFPVAARNTLVAARPYKG